MRTWLHSSQVHFTRDGSALVVAEVDGVTFVELRGDGRRRIAVSGVQSIARVEHCDIDRVNATRGQIGYISVVQLSADTALRQE